MTDVRLSGTQRARCPYCRDELDETGVRCEGCNTEVHAECLQELGRCPTLGCSVQPDALQAAPDPAGEQRQRGSREQQRLQQRREGVRLARGAVGSLLRSGVLHGLLLVLLAVGCVVGGVLGLGDGIWDFFKYGDYGRVASDEDTLFIVVIVGCIGAALLARFLWWVWTSWRKDQQT